MDLARVDAGTVDGLVEAYQATLGRARDELGEGWETKIVVATVAEHARATRQRLVTSVIGGDELVARLDRFIESADSADVVGHLIKAGKSYATDASKKLVKEIVSVTLGLSAAPTITAVVGAVLAFAGVLDGFGKAIGGGIAGLIIAVILMMQRNPAALGRLTSILPSTGRQIGAGLEWASTSFISAVRSADGLGRRAEPLVNETLTPASRAFYGSVGRPPGFDVPARVRGAAKTILYMAAAVIAGCLLIVGIGIANGISDGMQNACPTFPGQICT